MKFRCYIFLVILFSQSVFGMAQSEVDSLRSLLDQTTNESRIDVLNAIASRLLTIDVAEAQRRINESLTLSEEIGYLSGQAKAYMVKATLFSQKSRFEEAESLLQKAEALAEAALDPALLANTYLIRGTMSSRQNDIETSISNFLKGLSHSRSIPDPLLEGSFLLNIGRDYELIGKPDKALEYYEQALTIYKREQAQFRIGQVYINMGVIAYMKGNYGQSIEFNKEALIIFELLGDRAMTALSLQNIGYGHWLLGQNKKALDMYDRSMELRQTLNDQYGIGKLYLNRAKVFSTNGDIQATDLAAHKALEAAGLIDHKILKRDTYAFLYEFYRKRKEFESALVYHERLAEVKDSLARKAREEKVAALMAEYEFNQLLTKNNLQEQESLMKGLQIKQRNWTIVALVVLFLFVFILYHLQRKRMQAKLELAEKDRLLLEKEKQVFNTQLKSQKEHILLKDQVLEVTQTRLQELEVKEEASNHQEEFIDKLNDSLAHKDWGRFNLYFEQLYPGFLEKLSGTYTDITLNDQRLMAMIKINLTNKEVANTLNISPDSVIRAKHRLRNKMGFDTSRQMEDFIHHS